MLNPTIPGGVNGAAISTNENTLDVAVVGDAQFGNPDDKLVVIWHLTCSVARNVPEYVTLLVPTLTQEEPFHFCH